MKKLLICLLLFCSVGISAQAIRDAVKVVRELPSTCISVGSDASDPPVRFQGRLYLCNGGSYSPVGSSSSMPITASRAAVSDSSGNLAASTTTAAQILAINALTNGRIPFQSGGVLADSANLTFNSNILGLAGDGSAAARFRLTNSSMTNAAVDAYGAGTGVLGATTVNQIAQWSSTNGGVVNFGASGSATTPPFTFYGLLGSASPTVPGMVFSVSKYSGSAGNVAAFAATEKAFRFENATTSGVGGGTDLLLIYGNGRSVFAGTVVVPNVAVTASVGSTTTLDLSTGNIRTVTFGAGNATLAFSNLPVTEVTLILIQDATGNRTMTWPASVKWGSGVAPTLSTAASAIDTFKFACNGTICICTGSVLNAQ